MNYLPVCCAFILAALVHADPAVAQTPAQSAAAPHNVVIFIADGLRARSVNDDTAPNMAALARQGVTLANGHSIFPTFTTANASAMATGHYLGDTGDFSNTIYTGWPVPAAGGTVTPFLENDVVLGEVDAHFGGDYLDETTVLALARAKGYATASIGKVGPVLMFDHTERTGHETVIIDDATGSPAGIPLSAEIAERMKAAGLTPVAPGRGANAPAGNATTPGTKVANVVQQDWMIAAATRAVLPAFAAANKPFLLVFWSRDPDGTQHNQGDSLLTLKPGINGPTSLAAIRNVDDDLGRIRAALAELGLAASTDIIVTADHGFSTISKESETSPAAKARYADVPPGLLPPGFLVLDLAKALGLPLIDPDDGYKAVGEGAHSRSGNGLIGGDKDHPRVVVAANGGSDLVYIPDGDHDMATKVVDALLAQDYVSGLFVHSRFGRIPGTLPLSEIALEGRSVTPPPAIVVNFRSFDTICGEPVRCAVTVSDTGLQQGQGMHGSFSRADTWNFMAAVGPDFRAGFVDPAPASNADVGRTVAAILRLEPKDKGKLAGRVLAEAMPGGALPEVKSFTVVSDPAGTGLRTVLDVQAVGEVKYFDAAGFPGRTVGLSMGK
ncbi:MAG: alkaline phosphatase family protein [Xanthobacteraceae bacterium]|nr:alkaline phosphatase family protein [Xanthobacteraceae bacterium]